MKYDLLKYTLLIWLLLGGYACVPTDTGVHNPDEKIYCDIKTQLNGSDQSVKSEVRFYVKDEESRPYFLDDDVKMNGKIMEKKFIEHKGIFYSLVDKMKGNEGLVLSFTNLDDVKYDIELPVESIDLDGREGMTIKDLKREELREEESFLLIDEKGKVFDFRGNKKVPDEMTLDKMKLIKIVTNDSLYQLKDKLWIKYNTKSLSAAKTIEILE